MQASFSSHFQHALRARSPIVSEVQRIGYTILTKAVFWVYRRCLGSDVVKWSLERLESESEDLQPRQSEEVYESLDTVRQQSEVGIARDESESRRRG